MEYRDAIKSKERRPSACDAVYSRMDNGCIFKLTLFARVNFPPQALYCRHLYLLNCGVLRQGNSGDRRTQHC